jgi:glycosyltransferase involved in cell wall biosynthesis
VFARVPHILAFEHSTYFNKSGWQVAMDRELARLTDRIIVSTESVKEFTAKQERLPEALFAVLRNPVVIPKRNEVDIRELWKTLEREECHPLFLTIGRFSEEKGQHILLEAAEIVHKKFPSAHFLLVGHGPKEEELREYVLEHDMDSFVTILHAPHRAKEYYFLADWFVLPSLREGQSIVIEEAMSAGLPVVATKLEGIGQIVEEAVTGYLTEVANADALAVAIGQTLEHPERRERMSLAAYEKAKKQFSSGERVKMFEDLCREVVEGKLKK